MQENGPNENNRQGALRKSDVGGSQTNPHAEDVELEVFTTTSIYCVKYSLWRKLQVPIQNMSLALAAESDVDLLNWLEIRQIMNLPEPSNQNEKKLTIQQFMSQ